jgi:oligoribonuclease NrnB/cAMP/cGMP phosphodiesterase (DHH superfamily)
MTTTNAADTQNRPLVIYHAGCADGAGAALAAYMLFGESAEYRPAKHVDPIPPTEDEVRGRVVCILDFSYPRDVIERLQRVALSLTVIDHHKTAVDRLAGLDGMVIEMDQAGAALAWRELVGETVPELIRYIEDRDLWRWHLPHSREISMALPLRGVLKDFRALKPILENWDVERTRLIAEGVSLVEMQRHQVGRMTSSAELVELDGLEALAVNATAFHSEVGDELTRRTGLGITWCWDGKRRLFVVSLRSTGDVDVSEIAAEYGGGGHRRAASFVCRRLPWAKRSIVCEVDHAA